MGRDEPGSRDTSIALLLSSALASRALVAALCRFLGRLSRGGDLRDDVGEILSHQSSSSSAAKYSSCSSNGESISEVVPHPEMGKFRPGGAYPLVAWPRTRAPVLVISGLPFDAMTIVKYLWKAIASTLSRARDQCCFQSLPPGLTASCPRRQK